MDFRVYINKASHHIYQKLTDTNGVFPQMSDLFFWCVVLGYKNGETNIKLEGAKTHIFDWSNFDAQTQVPALKMIAVSVHGDFTVLDGEDENSRKTFQNIVQGLAEAGLKHLMILFEDENMITSEALFAMLVDKTQKVKKSK